MYIYILSQLYWYTIEYKFILNIYTKVVSKLN